MSDMPSTSTSLPDHSSAQAAPALTRDIGHAERALRALLERQLGAAGLSFPAWTVLVSLDGAGPLTRDALIRRQLDGHVVPTAAAAEATVEDLLAAGWLAPADASDEPDARRVVGGSRPLVRTPAADAVYRPVREAVARITHTLYGDLPAGDLEATRRTLGEIALRANALLAGGAPPPT